MTARVHYLHVHARAEALVQLAQVAANSEAVRKKDVQAARGGRRDPYPCPTADNDVQSGETHREPPKQFTQPQSTLNCIATAAWASLTAPSRSRAEAMCLLMVDVDTPRILAVSASVFTSLDQSGHSRSRQR